MATFVYLQKYPFTICIFENNELKFKFRKEDKMKPSVLEEYSNGELNTRQLNILKSPKKDGFFDQKMKKILLGLLVFLILNNAAYASGPVINGFYIGMTKQEAIDNANKLGLTIDKNTITDTSFNLYNKTGRYGSIIFANDIVFQIGFNPKLAFNWQAMDFEKFIYAFCANYKIPIGKLIKLSEDFYSYKDYDEGYLMFLTPIDIGVSILQKPSELQFK